MSSNLAVLPDEVRGLNPLGVARRYLWSRGVQCPSQQYPSSVLTRCIPYLRCEGGDKVNIRRGAMPLTPAIAILHRCLIDL